MSDDHQGHEHNGHEHNGHEHNGHNHDVAQHDPEAAERNKVPFYGKRIYAIRELLVEKGVLTRDKIQDQIDYMEARSPANGARLVARAWVDPAFKQLLLADPKAACAEMGIDATSLTEFVVLENTETVHNLVVCTLCSCYPRPILGRPPDWYKSFAYRSRAVVEPRAIMREFGTELPEDIDVRVFDSSADMRYLVLPLRPAGTESLTEPDLAALVTRDSMIGVTQAKQPTLIGESGLVSSFQAPGVADRPPGLAATGPFAMRSAHAPDPAPARQMTILF